MVDCFLRILPFASVFFFNIIFLVLLRYCRLHALCRKLDLQGREMDIDRRKPQRYNEMTGGPFFTSFAYLYEASYCEMPCLNYLDCSLSFSRM